MGTKSALAARDHYMNFYLKSPTAPLPNTLAGPLAQAAEPKDDVVVKMEVAVKKEENEEEMQDKGQEQERKEEEKGEEGEARDDEHKAEELESETATAAAAAAAAVAVAAEEQGKGQDEEQVVKKEVVSADTDAEKKPGDADKEASGKAPDATERDESVKGAQKNGKKKGELPARMALSFRTFASKDG